MATIVTVIASVRAAAHRPATGTGGLDDATLVAWANEELPPLFARIGDDAPSYFEKVTGDIPLADGTITIDLTASPASLTDFRKVRLVELKSGSLYLPMRWAPASATTVPFGMGATYRVKYLPSAHVITSSVDVADLGLPAGLERTLIETLAARVRRRFNEDDQRHVKAAEDSYKQVVGSLLRMPLAGNTIPNYNSMLAWPRWRFRGPATVEIVGGW